jgi:hypothetical protein
MTFMYNKQAPPAVAAPTIPAVSGAHVRDALRVIAVLALTAITAWVVYEAVSWQDEQQMIHEFQLGDRM